MRNKNPWTKIASITHALLQKKQTPLHLAASAGQLPVCNLLIELGASLDATDDYGQKPIHLAAQSNKPEVVKLFLKQRPSLVSVTTKVSGHKGFMKDIYFYILAEGFALKIEITWNVHFWIWTKVTTRHVTWKYSSDDSEIPIFRKGQSSLDLSLSKYLLMRWSLKWVELLINVALFFNLT